MASSAISPHCLIVRPI